RLSALPLLDALVVGSVQGLFPLLPLPADLGVFLGLLITNLAAQLPVALQTFRRQATVLDRGADGAARLALVSTVGEPAAPSQFLALGESRLHAFTTSPELYLAHSGCVEEQAAAGPHDQPPPRRGVPALAVGAQFLHGQRFLTDQVIDERR